MQDERRFEREHGRDLWRARGDVAHSIGAHVLREYDLVTRRHRVLVAWNPAENAVVRAQPISFATFPGGLCVVDRDEVGPNLRFYAYALFGEMTLLQSFPLLCPSVAFDEASESLLVLTASEGLWVARRVDGEWRAVQRVAHVPTFNQFGADTLMSTVNGLHVYASSASFKVVNLERERPEIGIPLLTLCEDPSRAAELD